MIHEAPHYGIEIIPFGEWGDARVVMDLARLAEASGWEGVFLWDHLSFVWGAPAGDPWVALAAAATVTERLRLGTDVSPLPRYRPALLARTLVALDRLSNGRAILGAGSGGVPQESSAFGDPDDAKTRAELLDESLAVLDGLMSGEPLTFHGRHLSVEGVTFSPLPVQRPRVPIWIGGESKAALRRAARWDGWVIGGVNEEAKMIRSPEQLAGEVAAIREHLPPGKPFDVAISGCSSAGERAMVAEYIDAGATWWIESVFGLRGSLDEMKARIAAGPPR